MMRSISRSPERTMATPMDSGIRRTNPSLSVVPIICPSGPDCSIAGTAVPSVLVPTSPAPHRNPEDHPLGLLVVHGGGHPPVAVGLGEHRATYKAEKQWSVKEVPRRAWEEDVGHQ